MTTETPSTPVHRRLGANHNSHQQQQSSSSPTLISSSCSSSAVGGWDEPPPVASPMAGQWQPRATKWRTPQRLATLQLRSQSQLQDGEDHGDDHDEGEGEGAFMCAPVIWNDRYIVTASHPGEVVLFGDITSTATATAASSTAASTAAYSITKLSLESDASIVTIQVASATMIYLLSVEGHVHQVTLLEATTTTTESTPTTTTTTTESSTSKSKSNVSLHLQASWNTNMCGATCMTVLHHRQEQQQQQGPVVGSSSSSRSTIQKKNNPHHQLIIGYDAGYLECWNIIIKEFLVEEEENKEEEDDDTNNNNNKKKQKKKKQHPPKPNLQWRGLMENSVRSVCPLPRRNRSSNQRRRAKAQDDHSIAADEENAPSETQDDDKLELDLVITLQSEISGTTTTTTTTTSLPPTTTMMQVLDLGAVQNAISTNTPKQQDDKAISMAPYIRLPAPGMELVDASSSSSGTTLEEDTTTTTRTGRLPKRVSTLSSRGTNGALALTTTPATTQNNGSWCCGVTLSDGTVAILSPGWGIRQDPHQLLLSYPAIGSGHISSKIAGEQEQEYLVCCLRGGTCYLIPTTTTWHGEQQQQQEPHQPQQQVQDIGVISYPQDTTTMDTGTPNTSTVYVQGFTAGTLQVKKDTTTVGNASSLWKKVSVLVYAWAGGVIDIYACGLQCPATNTTPETTPPTAEQIVLQELIDKDALSMVVQIFHKMDQNQKHPLHQDEQWVEARKQVKSKTTLLSSPRSISMDQLCSNELGALRGLLLTLASSAL